MIIIFFFFFQAEDGIRDHCVTGVQTCALPIFTVAAGAVGLAQACLDASVRYAHERHTFGQEIGEHQLVKQLIAKMAAGTEMGRLLVWRAAWLKNQGLRNTRETSLAKWHATEHSVQSALDAIQIHGANGYSNEFPVE